MLAHAKFASRPSPSPSEPSPSRPSVGHSLTAANELYAQHRSRLEALLPGAEQIEQHKSMEQGSSVQCRRTVRMICWSRLIYMSVYMLAAVMSMIHVSLVVQGIDIEHNAPSALVYVTVTFTMALIGIFVYKSAFVYYTDVPSVGPIETTMEDGLLRCDTASVEHSDTLLEQIKRNIAGITLALKFVESDPNLCSFNSLSASQNMVMDLERKVMAGQLRIKEQPKDR